MRGSQQPGPQHKGSKSPFGGERGGEAGVGRSRQESGRSRGSSQIAEAACRRRLRSYGNGQVAMGPSRAIAPAGATHWTLHARWLHSRAAAQQMTLIGPLRLGRSISTLCRILRQCRTLDCPARVVTEARKRLSSKTTLSAQLSSAQLSSAQLSSAQLSSAQLSSAQLSSAPR